MTLLAHLTDLHLLEAAHAERSALQRGKLALLGAGAVLDANDRRRRALAALRQAKRYGADHVIITGDLTEDGSAAQFEVLADVLESSGIDPACVTLVAGNHDAYGKRGAFDEALRGPLHRFRKTSRARAFSVLDGAVIAPIDTSIDGQRFPLAGGAVRADDVHDIARLAADRVMRGRALVVVQHHPLQRHTWVGLDLFHSVDNTLELRELLVERPSVHVLHGHVHCALTHRFSQREHAQVFAAPSVRDDSDPLRLYRAQDGVLREVVAPSSVAVRVSPSLARHTLALG